MAQIRIITVGKLKEAYFVQAQVEYLKRLQPYLKLAVEEVSDFPCPEGASPAQEEQVRQREGALIKALLRPKDYLVVLDRQGKEFTSPELAGFLKDRSVSSEPIVFVIGGSLGVSADLIKDAQLVLSFSRLTFPHQLFRVILLEQIYRAVKINRNEPYHK
jgi:23S rRNA (pseudouridine1915-N3)-methyltransferase